ncbi:hypothetical protein SAURM35S_03640 [Streptomyces aurantiogriseus]
MRRARSTTRKRFLPALATLLGLAVVAGLFAPATAQAAPSPRTRATGLHISDGRLLEGNGNDFIMRGVNHAHTWYPGETQSLADVKALGANTVRVVLSNGHRWTKNSPADVANVIAQCKANRLICVLEVHDTTGYGEEAAAGTLDQAADYWIGLKDVLAGQENYVIVNIGNEPWGNTNPQGWTDPTIAAIKTLRNAGLEHTIMVDAPNWGQDWQGVMRANARSVYDADPTGNLIFSIHMYSVFDGAVRLAAGDLVGISELDPWWALERDRVGAVLGPFRDREPALELALVVALEEVELPSRLRLALAVGHVLATGRGADGDRGARGGLPRVDVDA